MWTLRSCLPVLSSGGNVGCKSWLQKSVRQHSIVRRNCAFGESCWREIRKTFRFWSDQLGQALGILLIQLSRNKSLGHFNLKTQTNKQTKIIIIKNQQKTAQLHHLMYETFTVVDKYHLISLGTNIIQAYCFFFTLQHKSRYLQFNWLFHTL